MLTQHFDKVALLNMEHDMQFQARGQNSEHHGQNQCPIFDHNGLCYAHGLVIRSHLNGLNKEFSVFNSHLHIGREEV